MIIKKIKISNFKCFKDIEVEFGNFNVLIGANASGKSNFIQIFKFLKDTKNGLSNAISMQGGIEYLRNLNVGSSEKFSIEVVSDQKYRRKIKNKDIQIRTAEIIYKLDVQFKTKGLGFDITEDKYTLKYDLIQPKKTKSNSNGYKHLGEIKISIFNDNGKVKIDTIKIPQNVPIQENDLLHPFLKEIKLEKKELLLNNSFLILPFMPPIFDDIAIYDFDPKLPKRATPISGKAELEEDGNNLAIVLKNIIEDKEGKRKFSNLIKDLLPFVDGLDVEPFSDKSLLFNLKETYTKKHPLPASLLSDGTINITALIIALYFEKKALTIIEEPERNIHPYLISKITSMMKEASKNKQIIITTHNPELVKHAELEDLLLISRDKNGFSTISKPSEKDQVKIFLNNHMGVEDLYVQNLLST